MDRFVVGILKFFSLKIRNALRGKSMRLVMEINLERVAYQAFIKEMRKTSLKTVEKAIVYIHTAIEMADGEGEKINYLI
jgi:K+ transporter